MCLNIAGNGFYNRMSTIIGKNNRHVTNKIGFEKGLENPFVWDLHANVSHKITTMARTKKPHKLSDTSSYNFSVFCQSAVSILVDKSEFYSQSPIDLAFLAIRTKTLPMHQRTTAFLVPALMQQLLFTPACLMPATPFVVHGLRTCQTARITHAHLKSLRQTVPKVDNPNNADIMSPTSIIACNDRPNPRGHSIVYFVVGLLTHRIEHSLPSHPRRSPLAGKHTNNGLLSEEVSIATFRLQRFTAAGPSRICFLAEAENAPKFPVHEVWSFQTSPPRTL